MTIFELSIALTGEYDAFAIGYIGTLFHVGDAEIAVSRTRVESF